MKPRVALGMSGGVDSTMSALILMEQGYDVTGITMSTWDGSLGEPPTRGKGCYGPGEPARLAAAHDACEKLGIEHRIIRLAKDFDAIVLDYFRATYLAGKTPNPCVICNRHIKFGLLPELARAQGVEADYFATGHYARICHDAESGRWQLRKAADPSKDQSYFLCFLRQEQLSTTLFPLGGKTKRDIRALAEQNGFAYLNKKKESQDFLELDDPAILFPPGSFAAGDILGPSGKVLGKHRGLIHYTIGQRRNLGVSGLPEPWYVIEIDAAKNTVTLGPKEMLYRNFLEAASINWVSIPSPRDTIHATAKIRVAHDAAECDIHPMDDTRAEVIFAQPQMSITPGQVVAFYQDDLLLGGGIIQ